MLNDTPKKIVIEKRKSREQIYLHLLDSNKKLGVLQISERAQSG